MSEDKQQELDTLWGKLLEKYPNGVSNTSITKFNDIQKLFAEICGIGQDEIYITGAATRSSNFDTRLVQGNQTDRHTKVGLAIFQSAADEDELKKKADSLEVTCKKFIGKANARYDVIALIVEKDKQLNVARVLYGGEKEIAERISGAFPYADLKQVEQVSVDSQEGEPEKGSPKNPGGKFLDASPLNIIYYGPPGTGKTHHLIENEKKQFGDRYQFVTFHAAFSYEEFVEGIRPIPGSGSSGPHFGVVPGLFKELCQEAADNPSYPYLIIIDEINRGTVSAIFGELITLIERNKRGIELTLPYSKVKFAVPRNVYIRASMNTADRSLAVLDIAFRRRFEFVYCGPDLDVLETDFNGRGLHGCMIGKVDVKKMLATINHRLKHLYDSDHLIGHSFLMGVADLAELKNVFEKSILPLLEEYFYEDPSLICITLGESAEKTGKFDFYSKETPAFGPETLSVSAGTPWKERVYERRNADEWDERSFIQIYQGSVAADVGGAGGDDSGEENTTEAPADPVQQEDSVGEAADVPHKGPEQEESGVQSMSGAEAEGSAFFSGRNE